MTKPLPGLLIGGRVVSECCVILQLYFATITRRTAVPCATGSRALPAS